MMLEHAFDLGPHAAFIWSAYAVTAICLIGLTVGVVGSDRRQRRLLADLEARGITRRSAAKAAFESTPDTASGPLPREAEVKPARAKAQAGTKSPAKPKTQAKPKSQAKRGPTSRKSPAKPAQGAKRPVRGSSK